MKRRCADTSTGSPALEDAGDGLPRPGAERGLEGGLATEMRAAALHGGGDGRAPLLHLGAHELQPVEMAQQRGMELEGRSDLSSSAGVGL